MGKGVEEVCKSVWGECGGCEKVCFEVWGKVRKDVGKGIGGVGKCVGVCRKVNEDVGKNVKKCWESVWGECGGRRKVC